MADVLLSGDFLWARPPAADLVNQISSHSFSKEVAVTSDEPSPLVRLL